MQSEKNIWTQTVIKHSEVWITGLKIRKDEENKMKKTELITAIAEKSGLTKKDAEAALTATLDTIVETVAAGDKIQITGFGTFEQRQRNARMGCDPRTGNKIEIPASKVPAFKAGKEFKNTVNK